MQQRLIDDLSDEFDISLASDGVNDFVKISCNTPSIKINVCMMPSNVLNSVYYKDNNCENDSWLVAWYQHVVNNLKSRISVLKKL